MKIGDYTFEEIIKSRILKDPEIIYQKVKENPFAPIISNNVCIISTKFLREVMEAHLSNKDRAIVTDVESLDKWSFSRDHFTDDDWTEIQ